MATSDPNPAADTPDNRMPVGLANAYAFQVFNTISFSIVLGVPMMLFLKQLGAKATILGIAASLPPLLNILQIPAAKFVESIGYRTFVLRGWSTRSFLILGMAAVAFLPARIDNTTRIALMLLLLFLYNTSRGISVCGFLPWMTKLVPEVVRGRYISRDQMSSALAAVGAMMLNSFFLRHGGTSLPAFGGIFIFSFIAAMISLSYLRRIPDVPVENSAYTHGKVPWKEMMLYPPFLKFMIFNVIVNCAFAAAGVFWIPMFRDLFHFSDSKTLFIASWSGIISAFCLFFFGKIVDRVGSRPVIALGLICFILHFCGWACAAAGIVPVTIVTLVIIQIFSGMSGAIFNLANTRLLMGTVPAMGRSHFFALYSVITSLVLGLMPVVWGILLDSIAGWRLTWWHWQWNPYSLLYVGLAIIIASGLSYLKQLSEPKAMPTDEFMRELLINTPSRAITRLFYRKPLQ